MTQKISKKSLHILEDDISGVQVGDIEQVIVRRLSMIKLHQIDDFHKFWWRHPQVDNELNEYERNFQLHNS